MNKTISLSELYETDFNIKVLNSMKQDWKSQNSFSCINNPKTKNIFLCLNKCSAKYTLKNGDTISAKDGDIVYIPIGLEYRAEFFSPLPDSFTIGVNVVFFDDKGNMFIPGDTVTVVHTSKGAGSALFSEINDCFMSSPLCYAKIKSIFYEILSDFLRSIRSERYRDKKYEVIKNGIRFLEAGNFSGEKVKEIAEMCNVSEVYFRRLFKEYSGVSPVKYITDSKISRAKKYLKYENISICDIAEICGFESEAYFSRIFKKKTGMSPLKYREKF